LVQLLRGLRNSGGCARHGRGVKRSASGLLDLDLVQLQLLWDADFGRWAFLTTPPEQSYNPPVPCERASSLL
jgi:hypothetical protein